MKRTVVGIILVALVLAISSVAYAATTENGTVDVTASANAKLTLAIDDPTVDFGAVDPGTPVTQNDVVNVTVQSNKDFETQKSVSDPDGMGLSTAGYPVQVGNLAGAHVWPEDYSINIPWGTPAGAALAGSVVYTALQ